MISVPSVSFGLRHFFETSRDCLNNKLVIGGICTATAGVIALIHLAYQFVERGKPDFRATVLQPYKGKETYEEINTALAQAIPHISLIWGEIYLTAPNYRGYCYLEQIAGQVVSLSENHFQKSPNKEESEVGIKILKAIHRLEISGLDIYDEMGILNKCLHCIFFLRDIDDFPNLDNVTGGLASLNTALFKYEEGSSHV